MRLPVSQLHISFRLPDGHDDLALLEAHAASRGASPHTVLERSLAVLCRLATLNGGAGESTPAWPSLTVTDFESGLLGLRRFLLGDTVRCLVRCACSERMEIAFSIATLLREAQPRTPRNVLACPDRPGWFRLARHPASFRLPTLADQLDALASPDPGRELEQRCLKHDGHAAPGTSSAAPGTRGKVERAMEAMAPALSRPLAGVCAACGAEMAIQLHVPSLLLEELCAAAAGVHRQIHTIAATYHWPEAAILALPQLRRQAYTEAIQSGALAAGALQ